MRDVKIICENNSMNTIIQQNISILQQGKNLLKKMDDDLYQHCSETVFGSSIGSHVRHNLDHYTNFLAGLASGEINYENRQRDLLIETDRNSAMALIDETCVRLKNLCAPVEPLQLWLVSPENHGGTWATTSTSRELDFLMSHTIHHYAIVTIMCRLEGQDVEKGFGVAPSTLRYWEESNKQCAH